MPCYTVKSVCGRYSLRTGSLFIAIIAICFHLIVLGIFIYIGIIKKKMTLLNSILGTLVESILLLASIFLLTGGILLNRRTTLLIPLLIIWLVDRTLAKAGLCELETGNSNIIVDIEESRGSFVNQPMIPAELPVIGDPFKDIVLDLVFQKGPALFLLNGKKLQLLQPLDRDKDNLSHYLFSMTCLVKSSNKKRTIPIIVRVSDINDNAPVFQNTPYETTVPELTPIGTTIFQNIHATDADAGVNGQVEYFIVEGNGEGVGINSGVGTERITTADGYGFFSINLPHQGQVTVNRTLDYEKTQRYLVTVVVSDRARNVSERFSATTTLTVNIQDDDDQDPSFIYQGCMLLDGTCINPEYSTSVSSGVLSGILNIYPEKIQAVDMDTINSPIRYSFLSGVPGSFRDFFEINPHTGAVRQIKPVDTAVTKRFDLIIKATEVSEQQRSTTAKLSITVKPVDTNPPVIHATAIEGFVDENAPIGTHVIDAEGNPIVLTVTDADLGPDDPKPIYKFELTSSFFKIDQFGVLIVNDEHLDRDPPSPGKFRFQVVAREKIGIAASSPLSLIVTLNDINDNAPYLPMISPITIQAGDTKRPVIKIEATDNDFGDNAIIKYSIFHVSNNGQKKFTIDPDTGLIETAGKVTPGEQYSISVQATDRGGLSSQTIVEVAVTPGPNTKAPEFQQPVYEIQVSEGASINSTVATLIAIDPENDPVTYSIASGNDLRQFSIGDTNGVITVRRKLDREDLNRYQLLIRAEDNGHLSSTATVNIKVTDINDKNPEFESLPYEFKIEEGPAGRLVGQVHATDADEGINALVSYHVPDDIPFSIDSESGDVTTKIALDYETQSEYKFTVTAKDGAPDPRIATATVTVNVIDIEDELPIFHRTEYKAVIPENMPDTFVVQVLADDPDTIKRITYIIRQGPTDQFRIDAKTGEIYTLRGLDFERESQHILIIGTVENEGVGVGATTRVVIDVEDRNDIPPVFTSVPRPITLDDEASIGSTVTNLIATDSDGTAPGNKVRYELIGRGKSSKYFQVDPDTGVLRVRDDLRKDTDSEYQVDIRAYDLGEPQLSSVMTVQVYVRHIATVPPEVGLAFADDVFTANIAENAINGTLVKTLTILNNHVHTDIPLKCNIANGNDNNTFFASITPDRNCALYLTKLLDFETKEMYELEIQLDSLQGLVNPMRSSAVIKIQVVDVNDNLPEFVFPRQKRSIGNGTYFGAVSEETGLNAVVLQVKATDEDSGKFGKVKYKLIGNDDQSEEYFGLDDTTGTLRTKKSFDNVDGLQLPFRFKVEARDNPISESDFNVVTAPVIINVISDANRMVLVMGDAKPDVMATKEDTLVDVLESHSGLVVGVERMASRQYVNVNGSLETDPLATDVWFYAVDPETGAILQRNHSRVMRSIFDKLAMDNITFDVTGLVKYTASSIHEPIVVQPKFKTAIALSDEVYPYALIVIACIIFILGIAGIVYICISWSRYKAFKEQMVNQRSYVVPSPTRYDPVFVEPNLKEYETQVLQMSVPLDEDNEFNDLQLDFSSKNHAFSLDNVSYITKDTNDSIGQHSPNESDTATTARASSVIGMDLSQTLQRKNAKNMQQNNLNQEIPIINPLYQRSHQQDEEISNMNTSPSNENVMFREKKDYSHLGGFSYLNDRNIVETTTEL